jgi:hypothetical protein
VINKDITTVALIVVASFNKKLISKLLLFSCCPAALSAEGRGFLPGEDNPN